MKIVTENFIPNSRIYQVQISPYCSPHSETKIRLCYFDQEDNCFVSCTKSESESERIYDFHGEILVIDTGIDT